MRPILIALASGLLATAAAAQDTASFVTEWAASAHAKADAEAFTHWNDEGEIPPDCAICHSGAGFRDFYGLDGTARGAVDNTIAVGGVIDCDTCHVQGIETVTEVRFPSGMTLAAPPQNATCFTCHQGRVGGARLAEVTAAGDPDAVDPELSFLNPHYKPAAATQQGSLANGLFQYPGKEYVGRFGHVENFNTCIGCHSPHALEVATTECAACHGERPTTAIRARQVDWDGDGDVTVGVAAEIASLHARLGEALAAYARSVAETPVAYDSAQYPYFFTDTNGNGTADADEAVYPNRYTSWTPRMLRAAYNYQFVGKDPGAYAHNARYAIQALIDSIEDLGGDISELKRP